MPVAMRNRLGQGIACYRYLGPFRILGEPVGRPVDVMEDHRFVRVLLNREPDWAIFPPTHSPDAA